MEKPLKMRVISRKRIRTELPGAFGFAQGRNLFVVSTALSLTSYLFNPA
jgi:hypothetical protein